MDRLQRESPEILCALLQETCACLVQSERELVADLRSRNRELEQTLDYLRRTHEVLGATERLARTDELTGLYNRRCFNVQTPRLIDAAANEDLGLGLLLADLDHLKIVNDQHGHAVGDALLEALGTALRAVVAECDLPCRLGGDEFAVLLTGVDEDEALARARRLRDAVRGIAVVSGSASVRPTVSIGGALYEQGDDAERLLRRADESLYAAKTAGRDRIVFRGRPDAAAPPA
jgi:diguanylate cyclase (GGDEF)-like protein